MDEFPQNPLCLCEERFLLLILVLGFPNYRNRSEMNEISHNSLMKLLVTLSSLFTVMADKLASANMGAPIANILPLLVLPVLVWSSYKAQMAANHACNEPDGAANCRYSIGNFVWIFLGCLGWLSVMIGLYNAFIGNP